MHADNDMSIDELRISEDQFKALTTLSPISVAAYRAPSESFWTGYTYMSITSSYRRGPLQPDPKGN